MNYRLLLFALILISGCKTTSVSTDLTTAFIGTYTRTEGHVDGQADGIYRVSLNPRTGEVSGPVTVATTTNPSFLRLSNDKRNLYAVSELARGDEPTGFIHAFRVEGETLVELNKLPTHGKAPCHVELDKTGEVVIAANYVGGVATVYRRKGDGSLQETDRFTVSEEQKAGKSSWLHSANVSPDNKLVAMADKGLDRIWLFRLDPAAGKLTPLPQPWVQFADGDGPRHATWS
ncbi:MAG: beta-propeller fold lactonase family protein, partial [Bacteroidota bacterium]